MELYEVKYFLAVAEVENIHHASRSLHISPASLSKAISRLEDELDVSLFRREGRNIRLTEPGKYFRNRARDLADMEESIKAEISGKQTTINCIMAGREFLLGHFGMQITDTLMKLYPFARVSYMTLSGDEAIRALDRGNAHLSITSQAPAAGTRSVLLDTIDLVTVVGKGHPLYRKASRGEAVPIDTVMAHGFISPHREIYGRQQSTQSYDGWRDDKFPRKITFHTQSIHMFEKVISTGRALAYLPRFFAKQLPVKVLKISGCDIKCKFKIYMSSKRHDQISWLNELMTEVS